MDIIRKLNSFYVSDWHEEIAFISITEGFSEDIVSALEKCNYYLYRKRKWFTIESLVVKEEYRKQGIATELIKYAYKTLSEEHCDLALILEAHPILGALSEYIDAGEEAERLKAFYERNGFTTIVEKYTADTFSGKYILMTKEN